MNKPRISEASVVMIRRSLERLGRVDLLPRVLDIQHDNDLPVSAVCLALDELQGVPNYLTISETLKDVDAFWKQQRKPIDIQEERRKTADMIEHIAEMKHDEPMIKIIKHIGKGSGLKEALDEYLPEYRRRVNAEKDPQRKHEMRVKYKALKELRDEL